MLWSLTSSFTFGYWALIMYIGVALWRRGLQRSSFPCPPLSPRVCSNWCPLTRWCRLTVLSSVIYMICKYFLPLSRQCFNFIHGSSCGSFLVWHSLTCLFWFFNFYFWGQILKKSLPTYVKELIIFPPPPPRQEFYHLKSNIHVFNTFWVNFVYGIRWWSLFILLHVAFQFSHHLITLRCSRLGISLFSTLVFLLNVSLSLNNRSKYAL